MLLLTLLLVFPCAAPGENLQDVSGISIKADTLSYEKESSTYNASGNVLIEGRGLTLLADTAKLRQTDSLATADGNVVLVKESDVLRADHLLLNLGTEQGEVQNGDLFIKKGNFHIRSDRMKKVGKEDYRLERGTFTTCNGDSPSWKFTASDLDVTLEEFATGRNAVFYLKDIPLFYTPYISFPVKRERQSGFLVPQPGNSSKRGISLDIPYYWAISPSQDATFDLDLLSKRGAGTGLDYRYIWQKGSEGRFRGYLIYDNMQNRFRGEMSQQHQEVISPTLNFKANINQVTDRDFFRDYADAAGIYNQQLLESTISLTKYWQRFLFASEAKYVDDLTPITATTTTTTTSSTTTNTSTTTSTTTLPTLQKLPTLYFTGIRQRMGAAPLYFSLDSRFDNLYRGQGQRGQRFDLFPIITTYATPAEFLGVSIWGGYRERLYNAYGDGVGDGYHESGVPDVGGSVSTSVARVYDVGAGDLKRVRHMLIPEVSYEFLPERNQDALPNFDFNDRLVPSNMVTYSLTNVLTGKFTHGDQPPLYRDLLYLRLSQGYEFGGSRRDILTLVDEGRPLTDIRVEARLNPWKALSISTDSRYNVYHNYFSTTGLAADYTDGSDNKVGVAYRHARGELQYLEGRLGVALVKPFVFNYTARYSFDRGDFLESNYALEYKHQCWSVIFSYQERPDNRSFVINFTLSGIGSVLPIRAM